MILFNIFLFIFLLLLLILLSWVWPPNSPWAPWWRTNKETARALCSLARLKKTDIVYDLGCGDGEVLLEAARHYRTRGVGIEIEPSRYFFAKLRMRMHGVHTIVTIRKKNLFDENLSHASVVVVYLVPKTLSMLMPKLQRECKKGTKVISYRYPVGLPLKKEDTIHSLKLYVL